MLGLGKLLDLVASALAVMQGRSSRWPAVRKAHLRAFPACAACGTRHRLEVHHRLPVSWPGGKARELDPTNLLTLCEGCHLLVGHLADFRSANWDVVADAAEWRRKVQCRPYPSDTFVEGG
jgi:5-methylcytosine-specific restriction endonuclease McrA